MNDAEIAKDAKYFFIDVDTYASNARVNYHLWQGDKIDQALRESGNFFQTEGQAEIVLERIREVIRNG